MQKENSFVTGLVQGAAARRTPTVNILGHVSAGPGLARVFANVVHTKESRQDHSLVAAAFTRAFMNKATPVEGSFHAMDKAPFSVKVTGIVRANTQAVAFSEGMSGFRSLSSNVFADKEDEMWVLRKSANGDLLVKSTGIEDDAGLANLLDVCCSSASLSSDCTGTLTSLSSVQHNVQGGDYIQYVSPTSREVLFGFVLASDEAEGKLVVLSHDAPSSEGEVISKQAVTQTFDTDQFPDVEFNESESMELAMSSARGAVDIPRLLDYYRKVFARSGDYYNRFAAQVRSHCFM